MAKENQEAKSRSRELNRQKSTGEEIERCWSREETKKDHLDKGNSRREIR